MRVGGLLKVVLKSTLDKSSVGSFDRLASQGLSRDAPYRFVYISISIIHQPNVWQLQRIGESWVVASKPTI
jgi:hypothetical protein